MQGKQDNIFRVRGWTGKDDMRSGRSAGRVDLRG